MLARKSPLFAIFALLPVIHAHTRFTTLHINGQSQGDGVCIRQDQNPGTTTNFVPSITGPEMACGIDGTIANPSTCSVNAGDQISLEHRMWPDASQPGAIDISHKGNTAVYMKKINSQNDEVTGDGWFKIYFDGYDASTGEWGTDHMNANNGLVSTNIPSDLASGSYLIRSEVLALQELGNPQLYVGCAQVQLSGTGSAVPADTAVIPGYIDTSTPAMNVNIYSSFNFTEYGPKIYGAGGSGNSTSTASKAASTSASTNNAPGSSTTSSSGTDTTPAVSNTPTSGGSTGVSNTSNSNSDSYSIDDSNEGDSNDGSDDIDDDDEDDEDEEWPPHRHRGGHNESKPSWHAWGSWNNGRSQASRSVQALTKF